MLAAIRVLWHLPLMLSGSLPWVLGVGGNIAFQLLMMWMFVRTGGAWFLAAIWHSTLNALGGLFFFQMVEGPDKAQARGADDPRLRAGRSGGASGGFPSPAAQIRNCLSFAATLLTGLRAAAII